MTETESRCGTIAIVGRPNVGKSTLLNRIVGQKISITSRKPQTTWYQILGVTTLGSTQLIFVDTPGWQEKPERQLNRLMNRQIHAALAAVDVIVMVAEARGWRPEDDLVVSLFADLKCPKILVLNKHDRLARKAALLPVISDIQSRFAFDEVIPTNARTGDNVNLLVELVAKRMPPGPHRFPEDQVTDHSERFLVAELIREKLIRGLGQELPYAVSVVIAGYRETGDKVEIDAEIWVEREGQKGIVIGAKGERLKSIATAARKDIEALLQRPVYLQSWVKTKRKWSDDPTALSTLDLRSED